jgi:hypothetical protein
MMKIMMNLFLGLTLVFIPIMIIYYKGGAFEGSNGYAFTAITMGNLGFSESLCSSWFLNSTKKELNPGCKSG